MYAANEIVRAKNNTNNNRSSNGRSIEEWKKVAIASIKWVEPLKHCQHIVNDDLSLTEWCQRSEGKRRTHKVCENNKVKKGRNTINFHFISLTEN